jgi:hypothetical protein
MRNNSGTSLLEMMVALALFLLALGGISALLRFGVHGHRRLESRSDLQRNLLVVAAKIGGWLRKSQRDSVSATYPGGKLALGFAAYLDLNERETRDTDGSPLYSSRAIVYHAGDQLLRSRVALTGGTAVPSPLTLTETNAQLTADPGRVLLDGVQSFALWPLASSVPTTTVTQAFRLHLELRPPNGPTLQVAVPVRFY